MSTTTVPLRSLLLGHPALGRAPLAYAAAILMPLLTLVLRLLLWRYLPGYPFLAFIPSVALAALFGGFGPGVVATLVSSVLGLAWLAEPPGLWPASPLIWTGLILFVLVCATVIVLALLTARANRLAVDALAAHAADRESVLEARLRTSEAALEAVAVRRQFERRLEQVTDPLPVLISQVGKDGRFEFVNRAYEDWFGCSREDIKGRHLAEVLGPELFPRMKPRLDAVLAGTPVTFEEPAQNARGERREMRGEYIPNLGPSGEVLGYFALIQDVTEAKRQAELLIQRERHLRAVMESVTDCFYAVDRDWRITLFNRAAETYFGLPREQVLGRRLWEVFPAHVGSVFERQLERVMEERSPLTFEAPSVVFADRHLEMRVWPKEGSGLAVSFSDISARKAQERQRELMIHELNHRVKNTLAVVQSIAAQSLRDPEVPAPARAAFEGRLMALATAHDLLTAESWEAADLEALVRTALRPFQGEGRFEVSGPALRIRPQAAVSLALALHELATNAVKYGALSNQAGRVEVAWEVTAEAPRVFRLAWRERGGPAVLPPARPGFGSRLITRALPAELGGPVTLEHLPDGLACTVEVPLANLEAGER